MQTQPIAQRLAVATAVLTAFEAEQQLRTRTIDSMSVDELLDCEEFFGYIESQALNFCSDLTLMDVNRKAGLQLEYSIKTTVYSGSTYVDTDGLNWRCAYVRDEDGYQPETDTLTERITVQLRPEMTFEQASQALVGEVRGIDQSIYA